MIACKIEAQVLVLHSKFYVGGGVAVGVGFWYSEGYTKWGYGKLPCVLNEKRTALVGYRAKHGRWQTVPTKQGTGCGKAGSTQTCHSLAL